MLLISYVLNASRDRYADAFISYTPSTDGARCTVQRDLDLSPYVYAFLCVACSLLVVGGFALAVINCWWL